MKITNFTICLCLIMLSFRIFAQNNQTNAEEYAYYRNGKKVMLTPQPNEVFVTFANKVSLSQGKTAATGLTNQLTAIAQKDIFAPVNAVRYKVTPQSTSLSNSSLTLTKQFESDVDVITAYPAFTIGVDTLYVGNKITFLLKQSTNPEQVNAFLNNNKASIVEEINLGDKKIYVAAVVKGGSVFKLANGLFESGLVEYAEPNFTFRGKSDATPNDPLYGSQWFLNQASDADIDAPEAWNITTGSASVVVAVLDGHGFDLSHPDLAGKIVNAWDAVTGNNPWPQNVYANHGTPCAGLIAATTNNGVGVAGVGHNIKVLPISIGYNVESNGGFSTDEVIIARAAARVIATPGVVAVSNSYSTSSVHDAALREAGYSSMRYQSRGGLGAVILASISNNNLSTAPVYPANYPFVVGVGASNMNDQRAYFSNYGSYLDIVAPGISIITTDRIGTVGRDLGNYTSFEGTSAACPIVAGVVGLMASAFPNASALNYEGALLKSADKVNAYPGGLYYYSTLPGYPFGTWNDEMGYGRVNAYRALQYIMDPPTIYSFNPVAGPDRTTVTITGKNFIGATAVTFNNIPAAFTVVNATTITATVPPGNVNGQIRISNSVKTGVSSGWFTSDSYCAPAISVACTSGDYISYFEFGTLVNYSASCNGYTGNYRNHSPTGAGTWTTQVLAGQTYSTYLKSGPNPQGFGVWIDYNNDKDFDDTGEFVYSSPTYSTNTFAGAITIPANVSSGLKRVRVRCRSSLIPKANEACLSYYWGETEDYTITVTNPVVTSSQWNKRFGGSSTDNFSRVIRTTDGGYLLGGYSVSPISGDKTQGSQGGNDFWIVKTDASGNKQWEKRFGGNGDDFLNTLITTSDGGYLLGGNSSSGTSGDKSQGSQGGQDYWVVKINSTGTKQWDKRFGGSGGDDLRTLHQLSTGEYILSGYSSSGMGGDKSQASQGTTDYWVVKINSTGTKLWDKRFGGSGDDWLETTVLNSDGSILLGGRSASGQSGDKTQASQGGRDFWVVKINSTGTKQWDKRFGGSANDEQYAMIATSDGGFLLGGKSDSGISGDKSQSTQGGSDFWVIKINSTGTKLWDKRFGGSLTEDLRSIVQTSDGSFLLGGKSDSGISGDKSQGSQGGQDYWTIKINSSGARLWDKRFGGSAAEELRTVLVTGEGGYLLAGRSDSGISGDRSQSSQGGTDYWLVKLSASGGTVSLTTSPEERVATQEQEPENVQINLQAYPNPFKEKLTIDFTPSTTEHVNLKVYDHLGNEVKTLFEGEVEAGKKYELTWEVTSEKTGLYIIRLAASNTMTHKKVILIE